MLNADCYYVSICIHPVPAPSIPATSRSGEGVLNQYLQSIHGYNVDDVLDQPVSDMGRALIARSIGNWQDLLPYLGLTDVDKHTLLGNNPHSVEVQK